MLDDYRRSFVSGGFTGESGTWLKIRMGAGSEGAVSGHAQQADRVVLDALHRRNIKICVILEWTGDAWRTGVRPGGGRRGPLDLREVFERARKLGAIYGDKVDAWEIDNEPDIAVADNAEVMAAFQKACYLGLKAGATDAASASATLNAQGRGCRESLWRAQKLGSVMFSSQLEAPSSSAHRSQLKCSPLVLMAPLALPPGPYFERLWDNGEASYTDGFNYHYYGYAGDFTGVYRQFEDAVAGQRPESRVQGPEFRDGKTETGGHEAECSASDSQLGPRKTLPVFLTEYGYGLMSGAASGTVEGRVRQWRWFAEVAAQIRQLQPEGPMAFVLTPYFEAGLNEFGLLMRPGAETKALSFTPADFGETKASSWMSGIGKAEGADTISPALAYLRDYAARHPYTARDWPVRTLAPSPVVIDFIAGADMTQMRVYNGYGLQAKSLPSGEPERTGHGVVVLYNFSDKPVRGSLCLSTEAEARVAGSTGGVLTLVPGERREIPVELAVSSRTFAGKALRFVFKPSRASEPESVYETALYPGAGDMETRKLEGFEFSADKASTSRALLLARPLAREEPRLAPQGRWLVSDGVTVDDSGGTWRFEVDRFPAEPLRPAMAELPLPQGFDFKPGSLLFFQYRKVDTLASEVRNESRSGTWGESVEVYFRTANGNLYQTGVRMRPEENWAAYAQAAQNFTMWFWGRAALPWRFEDNRPVSLVFFFRPASLPFTFETSRPEIVKLEGRPRD